jgi:hypothetical protein
MKYSLDMNHLITSFNILYDDCHALQDRWEKNNISREVTVRILIFFATDIATEIYSKHEIMSIFLEMLDEDNKYYC